MSDVPHPRLLIVEDERVVALNLRQRLELLGYDVPAVAASGAEAIEQAQRMSPDLVLMDICIEGDIDGIETAARLNRLRPTPVIYISADSEESTLQRARATRPYGYLLKPFSEREMHATIQMALGRRQMEAELEASEGRLREGEAKLRLLNAELERRVAERTAELQAANKELEAFDYSISHDLRAPLRHIQGFGGMLLSQHVAKLDEAGIDCARRVVDAGKRMDQLVTDLLQLSTATRGELQRGKVDVSEIARAVLGTLQQSHPDRQVSCVVQSDLTARADPGLLRVVLDNLLGNAWKFTRNRDAPRIELGATGTGAQQAFFVRDNGAGFDMAYADKLFAPFQRLHSHKEFEGTGIGLATVQRIIRRHGGKVWAQAAPEKGATFYFTLQSSGVETNSGNASARSE